MDSLMELIKASQSFRLTLENFVNQKSKIPEISYELEKCSNNIHKMTNSIKQLQNIYGGEYVD